MRDPGYYPGLAREWRVCVLDAMRTSDLRCGKELLGSAELPHYRISDGCRARTASVGATCAGTVNEKLTRVLPSDADIAACRDSLDDAACDRIAHELESLIFANRAGVGCTVCGRHATDFVFASSGGDSVPAPGSLPFTQPSLDAIYTRADAGFGAVAARKCAHASQSHECFDLEDLVRVHPTHPDVASWQRTIARMEPTLDRLAWAEIDPSRCIRQRDDRDEDDCAKLRSYLERFPNGRHVAQARAALASSAPARAARQRAEEIEDCKKTCASPPLDWGMGPGPQMCARLLGRACK